MQKNRVFMHSFCIITRFWCGRKERSDGIARNERPGIEDIRRYEKSLDFQGFFAIERQSGRQKILIFQTANGNNEDTIFTLIGIRRGGDNH